MEREDMYEAAVRAVLDLCDEADDVEGMVDPKDLRKAIRDALLVEENDGQ